MAFPPTKLIPDESRTPILKAQGQRSRAHDPGALLLGGDGNRRCCITAKRMTLGLAYSSGMKGILS